MTKKNFNNHRKRRYLISTEAKCNKKELLHIFFSIFFYTFYFFCFIDTSWIGVLLDLPEHLGDLIYFSSKVTFVTFFHLIHVNLLHTYYCNLSRLLLLFDMCRLVHRILWELSKYHELLHFDGFDCNMPLVLLAQYRLQCTIPSIDDGILFVHFALRRQWVFVCHGLLWKKVFI